MKAKKTNPTTKKKRSAKKQSVSKHLGEYENQYTGDRCWVSERFLEEFGLEMTEKAKNDEEFTTIEDLFVDKGVPESSYYEWVNKYPRFKEKHNLALLLLGRRREKGGLARKMDSGMVSNSMHHYNDRWKKSEAWRASLKEKEKGGAGNITVVVPAVENSPEVPPRITTETPEMVAQKAHKKIARK